MNSDNFSEKNSRYAFLIFLHSKSISDQHTGRNILLAKLPRYRHPVQRVIDKSSLRSLVDEPLAVITTTVKQSHGPYYVIVRNGSEEAISG